MLLNTNHDYHIAGRTTLVPLVLNVHRLYDSVAEQYSRDEPKFRDDFISRPFVVELARTLSHGGDVLDVGCGDGHISRLVSPFVNKVVGIDTSPQMLNQAHKMSAGIQNVKFERINFLDLAAKIRGVTFDLCLAVYAVCCMKNLQQLNWAFQQMSCAVKPKGYAVIQVPSPNEHLFTSHSQWIEDIDRVANDTRGKIVRRWLRTVNDDWVLVARYHYLLHDYVAAIRAAGFIIEDTFEPKASDQLVHLHPTLMPESTTPSSIVFVARKS